MINGKSFLDQPDKSDIRIYDNIRRIVISQGDDYTTGCLLGYNYSNKHYKMIAIDLSKQKPRDAAPKAIQKVNFTGNLDREVATVFFIIEEAKGAVKVL